MKDNYEICSEEQDNQQYIYETYAEQEWLEEDNIQRASDMNDELSGSLDLHTRIY